MGVELLFHLHVIFLLIHLLNFVLRDELKTLSGKILTWFCLKRLLTYCIGLIFLPMWCDYGFIVYYYFLTSVSCWSTIMSSHVRRTLKKPINPTSDIDRIGVVMSEKKLYHRYVIYGTLIPITITVAIKLYVDGNNDNNNSSSNNLTGFNCRYGNKLFLQLPMILTSVVNLMLYVNCLYVIYYKQRSERQLFYEYRKRYILKYWLLTTLSDSNAILAIPLISDCLKPSGWTSRSAGQIFIATNLTFGVYVLILFTYDTFFKRVRIAIGDFYNRRIASSSTTNGNNKTPNGTYMNNTEQT